MYDYLVVGSGLYGAVFAREARNKGFKVLVIDKRNNDGGNIYTEKVEGINFHKYGAHISTLIILRFGTISISSVLSTVLQTVLWLTTKASYISCLSICTHSIKCGE